MRLDKSECKRQADGPWPAENADPHVHAIDDLKAKRATKRAAVGRRVEVAAEGAIAGFSNEPD